MLAPDRRKALTVSAKHRMTEPPEHGRISSHPSARRGLSGVAAACEIVCTSMLGAAALIVLLVSVEPEKPTVVAAQQPPRASQPVRQEGTVVAVTGNSVTARSANGYTQTYLVTPDTTLIAHGNSQNTTATSVFTVNDKVDIIGTIQGGTALATAVADRDVARGGGAPMDHIEAKAVSVTAN